MNKIYVTLHKYKIVLNIITIFFVMSFFIIRSTENLKKINLLFNYKILNDCHFEHYCQLLSFFDMIFFISS